MQMDNGGFRTPRGPSKGPPGTQKRSKWHKNGFFSALSFPSGIQTYLSFSSRAVGDVKMDNGGLRPLGAL